MCSLAYQTALSCDADSSQRVVSSNHPACQMSCPEGLDGRSCPRLQFILKDDQSEETKIRFRLLSIETLSNHEANKNLHLTFSSFEPSAMINFQYFCPPLQ